MNIMSTTNDPKKALSPILKVSWFVEEGANYNVTTKNKVQNTDYILIKTIDGSGIINTTTTTYNVSSGSILIINKNDIASYKTKGNHWKFYWFEFFIDVVINTFFFKKLDIIKNETEIFDMIFNDLNNGNAVVASSFFAGILSKYFIFSTAKNIVDEFFESIVHYINNRPIDENITITEICEKFNITARNLHHKFIKYYSISPKKYILSRKNEAIKILLKTTDMKIYEIAIMTGFSSEYYLSKFFKKQNGISTVTFKKIGI